MIIIVLAGLYLCLSLLFALAVGKFIPSERLPSFQIPRGLEQASVAGIILFSFFSLLLNALDAAVTFEYPLLNMFLQMLYGTMQGKGFLGILVCGVVWYGIDALVHTRGRNLFRLVAASGFLIAATATMHAASLSRIAFVAQTIHLFAVAFWLGFLFLVGWFAKSGNSWRAFLRWFSPAAVVCVILVIISGFMLMDATSSDWINAWVLNYGQALLVKHLLFIPLIGFAVINGVLMRKRLEITPLYDPSSWVKAESLMALAVFTAAAVLSQQPPPHNLNDTLRYTPPSTLFKQFYEGTITPDIQLALTYQPFALMFLIAAIAFLGMTVLCYYRRMHASIGLCTSLLFVLSGYIALMMSLK